MQFRKLFLEPFSQPQVKVVWNPERRPLPDTLISAMDDFWKNHVLAAPGGEHLFNGDLCRLENWQAGDNTLELQFGHTDYKELCYSNYRIVRGEDLAFEHLSYALGISAVLSSSDDQIILIQRSQIVGEFPGKLDVLGGHIHPEEHASDGIPDPFLAMQAEIAEEVGVAADRLALLCIGLLETVSTRKPELIFVADCNLRAKKILALAQRENSPEVASIFTIPADAITSILETRADEFSPSAYGGLCLYAEFLAME